ncbi:MAG: glycoside hydrolase family 2 protein [Armatimonadetes bacterium]|nr:glycoside hydrolase family 2 protein [Armatimonadota bacterium]
MAWLPAVGRRREVDTQSWGVMDVTVSMDVTRRVLHSGWEFAFADYGEVNRPEDAEGLEFRPATVPGTNLTDLQAAGLVEPDTSATYEDSFALYKYTDFVYRTRFVGGEEAGRKHVFLVFEGLDTICHVFLNGEEIGSAENAYLPRTFDVTGKLRPDANSLVLLFRSPILGSATRQALLDLKFPAIFGHDFMYIRKPAYSFYWDWGPEMPVSGIYRPVVLKAFDRAEITDFHIRYEVDGRDVSGSVRVEASGADGTRATLRLAGNEYTATVAGDTATIPFHLASADLWYPNGEGEPFLYGMEIALEDGGVLDARRHRIGFRTVEVVRDHRTDLQGKRFVFRVNGREIFIRGYNWIPVSSSIPSGYYDLYRGNLDLARDGNVNMLRVWGGGIYEAPEFYDFCDEFGILVWQDFMFSFAEHPDTEEFAAAVGREAHAVVARLRNHPCLALWCGNNECELDTPPEQQWHGKRLFYEVIPQAVRELDPERPYWPSSPYSGPVAASCEYGDYHGEPWFHASKSGLETWRDWIDKDKGLFMSEFPLHGPPEVETLRRFIPEEKLFPVEGKLWEPHIITDDHRKQKEGMTSRESLLKNIREMAGEPRSIEEFCYLGGVAHGEFLRAQIEHYRRRKFGVGGALLWMHDEAFPSVSYGIVDYYGRPKPAYYYARRAFAPLLLVFDREGDEMAAWVVNDLREPVEGVTSLLRIQEGRADAGPERVAFRVPANVAQRIWTGPPPKDPAREWLAGTLERDGRTVARSSYFLALFREIHFPPASVAVARSFTDGTLELDLRSDVYAFAVALEGLPDGARPDDHYLDLLPGETRRITVRGLSAEGAAGVRVKTWPLASG